MERHPPNVPPASVSTRMSMSSSTLSSMLDSMPTSHTQGNGSFGGGGGVSHPVPSSSTATAGGTDVHSSSSSTAHVPPTLTNSTPDFVDASSTQPAIISTLDASSPSGSKPKEVFEFTKRKRWADLLITELTEAIILVLSSDGIVWYCGNAVHDLLGWRDDEVIDREFLDIMNVDDRPRFQSMFRESIEQKSELLSYARLQCKPTEPFLITAASSGVGEFTGPPTKEVLFEIKGYPHFLPDTDEFKCFFSVAKPYPSRNTAMLNTFLELKIENERLQERLANLKIRKASLTSTSSSGEPPASSSSSVLPTPSTSEFLSRTPQYSHLYPPESSHGLIPPPLPNGELPTNASFYGATYEDLLPSPVNVRFDTSSGFGQGQGPAPGGGGEEDGVNTGCTTGAGDGPRKKMKKVYTAEQYVCVTCGRTDSPEWRKGPTGPKTLCNACGLRWAKRVRTNKGEEAGTGKNSG